jgi:hypothetical protein
MALHIAVTQFRPVTRNLAVAGTVTFNEMYMAQVSAPACGRIEAARTDTMLRMADLQYQQEGEAHLMPQDAQGDHDGGQAESPADRGRSPRSLTSGVGRTATILPLGGKMSCDSRGYRPRRTATYFSRQSELRVVIVVQRKGQGIRI